MLIDTHCHMNIMVRNYVTKKNFIPLSFQEIDDCKRIINTAVNQQVSTIINVGTDLIESLTCIDIAKHFDNCYATIGLHPTDATDNWQAIMTEFTDLLRKKNELKIIGIGECGIDKYHQGYDAQRQRNVFEAQIELALEHNLALIVHSRDADIETYETLYAYRNEKNLKGTIHCFSSDMNYAAKYLDLGFVLGFGGTITYPKNNELRKVVTTIPLEKIILETDAPFLPPQIIRGKQNSPAQIRTVAEYIAMIRNEPYEHIAATTTQTAKDLLQI